MKRPCLIGLAALALAGCYEPVEHPEVTRLLRLRGGTFQIGAGQKKLRCQGTDRPQRCDAMEKTANPLNWLQHLTWAPRATVKGLADFDIDEHEVTNAQYRYCIAVGPCSEPASAEVDGQDYWGELEYDRHPVVNVTRAQARTYCQWLGRTLPTEAQWERAARLGLPSDTEERVFPWGGDIDSACTAGEARYAVTRDCATLPPRVDYSRADVTAHGLRNMASNVAEWVHDDWSLYSHCAGAVGYGPACQTQGSRCTECKKDDECPAGKKDCPAKCVKSCSPLSLVLCEDGGAYKAAPAKDQSNAGVIRGGDFRHDKCFHRLFVRRKGTGAQPHVGFRCAREVN